MAVFFKGLDDDRDMLIMRGVTKQGVRRQLRFWAERGLIHCEDSIDQSYRSMSVRSFLHRVKALNDMLGKSKPNRESGADAALRDEVQRNIQKAEQIARKAQIQGQPTDASARRDLVRRRPKTVFMGSITGKHVL